MGHQTSLVIHTNKLHTFVTAVKTVCNFGVYWFGFGQAGMTLEQRLVQMLWQNFVSDRGAGAKVVILYTAS